MSCADDVRVAYPLFQEEGSGSRPTSALQLRFVNISVDLAINLNRLWHSRLPKVKKSNLIRVKELICYGAEFDGIYFAVAIWTNPISPQLPQSTILELRRLAIASDSPTNTASRMLGWMVRDIKKRLPHIERVISYQDLEVHQGTIYKAAGWVATMINKSGVWNRPNRYREKPQSEAPKQRWEKILRG